MHFAINYQFKSITKNIKKQTYLNYKTKNKQTKKRTFMRYKHI